MYVPEQGDGVHHSLTKGGAAILLLLAILPAGCSLDDPKYGPLRASACAPLEDAISRKLEASPNATMALYDQVSVEMCRKQYDLALKDMNEAIAVNPVAYNYEVRARIHLLQGHDDLAIEDFDRAVAIDPNYAPAYLQLATIYSFAGETESASSNLSKALAADGNDVGVLNGSAWIMATSPDPQLLNGVAAVKYATQACEITSWASAPIIDTLAAAYARQGKYDEAIKWEKEALRILAGRGSASSYKERLALYEEGKPYTQATWTNS